MKKILIASLILLTSCYSHDYRQEVIIPYSNQPSHITQFYVLHPNAEPYQFMPEEGSTVLSLYKDIKANTILDSLHHADVRQELWTLPSETQGTDYSYVVFKHTDYNTALFVASK